VTDRPIGTIPSGIKDEALLAERRATLVETATELFIARGFSEVSVNEIAERAGISVGALYKYIRTKEDLLWLVMDTIYGPLEDVLQAERREASDPARRSTTRCDSFSPPSMPSTSASS